MTGYCLFLVLCSATWPGCVQVPCLQSASWTISTRREVFSKCCEHFRPCWSQHRKNYDCWHCSFQPILSGRIDRTLLANFWINRFNWLWSASLTLCIQSHWCYKCKIYDHMIGFSKYIWIFKVVRVIHFLCILNPCHFARCCPFDHGVNAVL